LIFILLSAPEIVMLGSYCLIVIHKSIPLFKRADVSAVAAASPTLIPAPANLDCECAAILLGELAAMEDVSLKMRDSRLKSISLGEGAMMDAWAASNNPSPAGASVAMIY
jgi:hypothetical protein